MKKILMAAAIAAIVIAIGGSAFAGNTNSITVSATVNGVCKFQSGTSTIAFGAFDPDAASVTATTGNLAVKCTNGTALTGFTQGAGLNGGTAGAVNGANPLYVSDGSNTIAYYLNSTSTGNGTGFGTGSTSFNVVITGTMNLNDANGGYGNALAGNYNDTVIVTINP